MAKSEQLTRLRAEIELIDQEIFKLVYDRTERVRKIAELKNQEGLKVQDLQREKQLLNLYSQWQPMLPKQYLIILQQALLQISYLEHQHKSDQNES